jgi:hypothetical protein
MGRRENEALKLLAHQRADLAPLPLIRTRRRCRLQPGIPQAEEPVIPANWWRYEGRIPAYCFGNTTIYIDCQDPRWRQWTAPGAIPSAGPAASC